MTHFLGYKFACDLFLTFCYLKKEQIKEVGKEKKITTEINHQLCPQPGFYYRNHIIQITCPLY